MPTVVARAGAFRVGRAVLMVLAWCLVSMTAEVRAEQPSVEAAATAAGLHVETGAATVNGATISCAGARWATRWNVSSPPRG
jgi:hypothetical protein